MLAEIVGPTGHVTAVDLEEELVARAREALAAWPQVTAAAADGAAYQPANVDTIIASAGVTHALSHWLAALTPRGQVLVPLTGEQGWGHMLLATRSATGDGFAARFVGRVGIYHFAGARDAGAAMQLDAAFDRGDMSDVRSLRRDAHAADQSCWLHVDGSCLSRNESVA